MDRYNVLMRIWHTKDEQYYDDGDNVSLTHLADFQIERLVAQGVIEPVAEKCKKREVKQHGNTDSTEH